MSNARAQRKVSVPVIDLFAGPGGLGEGFSALEHERLGFDVVLSVEKDPAAHSTLLLRSFLRQLRECRDRERYYAYVRGELTLEELFGAFPDEAAEARSRCLHLEMAPRTTPRVYAHLERALGGVETWVLVGGPPCQAYSVVGRSRLSRLDRGTFEQSEKHVLYREYLRILARYLPPVFVMENVQGLLSATYGGASTFARMISDLSSPTVAVREAVNGRTPLTRRGAEYSILSFVHPGTATEELRPEDYVIAAEKFGVPQRRHRVILLGVRSDLTVPRGLCLRPSAAPPIRQVVSDLPPLRSQLSRGEDGPDAWAAAIRRAVTELRGVGLEDPVREAMEHAARCLRASAGTGGRCAVRSAGSALPQTRLTKWILDPHMGVVANHETRRHIPEDLLRYLFASSYALVYGRSPKLHAFPGDLLPNHQNVADTVRRRYGYFNDRFRVQVADQPATTVTSHIAKDGHYFIHHDPTQCRSWTVREAARVQTARAGYRVVPINWTSDRDDYEASDFTLRAEDHGGPQKRHRVILLGICRNLHRDPLFRLESVPTAPAVMEVLDDLPPLRSQLSKEPDSPEASRDVLQSGWRDYFIRFEDRKLRSFVRDAVALWDEYKNTGGQYVKVPRRSHMSRELREWYRAEDPNGACNHESRPHRRDDLEWYLFVSAYDVAHREPPKLKVSAVELLPKQKNAIRAREPHELFDDRIRVQLVA